MRGYEYPSLQPSDAYEWDANWLVVSGDLTLSDGRRHSFVAACLTTGQAAELRDWLQGIVRGTVLAKGESLTLDFVEPCLAFAASPLGGRNVELRVYLSLETEPPFVVSGGAGIGKNYVPFLMGLAALDLAAADGEKA